MYKVLYNINFEGNPSSSELDELESEYKAEAALRGLA